MPSARAGTPLRLIVDASQSRRRRGSRSPPRAHRRRAVLGATPYEVEHRDPYPATRPRRPRVDVLHQQPRAIRPNRIAHRPPAPRRHRHLALAQVTGFAASLMRHTHHSNNVVRIVGQASSGNKNFFSDSKLRKSITLP